MSDVIKPVKVEFIESYIKGVNGSADYQWNDNHGELIRCKDCKYSHLLHDKYTCSKHSYHTVGVIHLFDADWFCADGVKHDE